MPLTKAYRQHQNKEINSEEFLKIVEEQLTLAKQQRTSLKNFLLTPIGSDSNDPTLGHQLFKNPDFFEWLAKTYHAEKQLEPGSKFSPAFRRQALHLGKWSVMKLLPPFTQEEKDAILTEIARHLTNAPDAKKTILTIAQTWPEVFQFINSRNQNLLHLVASKTEPPLDIPGMKSVPQERFFDIFQDLVELGNVAPDLVDDSGNTPFAYLLVTREVGLLGKLDGFLTAKGFNLEETFIFSVPIGDMLPAAIRVQDLITFMEKYVTTNKASYYLQIATMWTRKSDVSKDIKILTDHPFEGTLAKLLKKITKLLIPPDLVNNYQRKDLLRTLVSFLSPTADASTQTLTPEMRQDYSLIIRQLEQNITISPENKILLTSKLGNAIPSLKILCVDRLAETTSPTAPLIPKLIANWQTAKTEIIEKNWDFFGQRAQRSLLGIFAKLPQAPNESDQAKKGTAVQAAEIPKNDDELKEETVSTTTSILKVSNG